MAAAQAEREEALEQVRFARDERENPLRRGTTCSCRHRRAVRTSLWAVRCSRPGKSIRCGRNRISRNARADTRLCS
jgi:hypothetical protein